MAETIDRKKDIHFSNASSPLGTILVAVSCKGICAIMLGDDCDILLAALRNDFPYANFIWDDKKTKVHMAQILAFIEVPKSDFDLSLDISGTPFQNQVWQALRQIALGTTVSYSELAQRMGQPKAARAVASACAANKIALAIPCHRVIRNDGALSGYRWGVERKRLLLEKEAQFS